MGAKRTFIRGKDGNRRVVNGWSEATSERRMVRLHPHAGERLVERGATKSEIIATVENGETFPAKYGRTGFRRNFAFNSIWRGIYCATKQIEAYAVKEGDDWLVITIVTRYF